jgi:hypothetical protein
MEEAVVVPWPEDFDEFKFPCHTSMINADILIEEMSGVLPKEDLKKVKDNKYESYEGLSKSA